MNTNNEDDEIEMSLSQNNTGGSSWASFGEHHNSDVADPSALNPASQRERAAVGVPSRPLGTMSKKSKVIVGIAAGAVFLVALSVGIIMGRTKETEQSTMVMSLSKCLDQSEYEEYKAYAINDTPTYFPTYSPSDVSTRDGDAVISNDLISNDLTLPFSRRRRKLIKNLSPSSDTTAESSNEAAVMDKSKHRHSRLGLKLDTLTKKKLETKTRASARLNENNENASTSNRIRKRYLNTCEEIIIAAYGSKSSKSSDGTRSSSKWSQSKSAKESTASPSAQPTRDPTNAPTNTPVSGPITLIPTTVPTNAPSQSPVTPSPSDSPNKSPVTDVPTSNPSKSPSTPAPVTSAPSDSPSKQPTDQPTDAPTQCDLDEAGDSCTNANTDCCGTGTCRPKTGGSGFCCTYTGSCP